MASPRLVLASNSPRRQELLGRLGVPFAIRTAPVDEAGRQGETPVDMVARLAEIKSKGVPLHQDEILIAADTTVALAGEVMGKPVDLEDSRRMLQALRDRVHAVHSGVVLRRRGKVHVEVVTTQVWMRPYGDAELQTYLDSGAPLDKAGAYGIQDEPFQPVSRIEGCYMNVVGLPLCHLSRALLHWGIALPSLPPRYCRTVLGHACPVALFPEEGG